LLVCDDAEGDKRDDHGDAKQQRGFDQEIPGKTAYRFLPAHNPGFAADTRVIDTIVEHIAEGPLQAITLAMDSIAGKGSLVTKLDQVALLQPFRFNPLTIDPQRILGPRFNHVTIDTTVQARDNAFLQRLATRFGDANHLGIV